MKPSADDADHVKQTEPVRLRFGRVWVWTAAVVLALTSIAILVVLGR